MKSIPVCAEVSNVKPTLPEAGREMTRLRKPFPCSHCEACARVSPLIQSAAAMKKEGKTCFNAPDGNARNPENE